MFEHTILPAVTLIGLCSIVVYGMWSERQDIAKAARKRALGEAAEAIQSLVRVADATCAQRRRDRQPYEEADRRAFYYQRAATIVRSIPVDRL